MAKKTKYKPRTFESAGEHFTDRRGKLRTDTSCNIYESMLLSAAYQSLNDRQARLYMLCKAQYYGKRKPRDDYKDMGLFQGAEYFYLNWAAVQQYGIYKPSMSANFYRDMQVLQQHGFIKLVSSGKGHKQKNVYAYSSDWQTWEPGK